MFRRYVHITSKVSMKRVLHTGRPSRERPCRFRFRFIFPFPEVSVRSVSSANDTSFINPLCSCQPRGTVHGVLPKCPENKLPKSRKHSCYINNIINGKRNMFTKYIFQSYVNLNINKNVNIK